MDTIELQFEWDQRKNKANLLKHGFSFENAKRAFTGPMLSRIDNRLDYVEERRIGLRRIEDVVVVIAYTMRFEKVRIISVRKANRDETKTYEEFFAPKASDR